MSINTSRWSMLSILCLYVFAVYFAFQALPPVFSLIMQDLDISHAQVGLFMSVFSLPAIFLTIPLSFLSFRFDFKKLGLASLAFVSIGSLIIIVGGSFPVLLLGRVIMGIGAVAVPVVGVQGVASWFRNYKLGLAMGIYSTCMFLSFVIAFVAFGNVGMLLGWKATVWIVLAISIIAFIVFAIFFKIPHEEAHQTLEPLSWRTLFQLGLPLWVMALYWGFIGFSIGSVVSFLPDFMFGAGFSLAVAGATASIIVGAHTLLSPLAGYVLDRMKNKEVMLLWCTAGTAAAVFLLPLDMGWVFLFVTLTGVFATSFAPGVYAIIPLMVKHQMLALAYGLITTLNAIGMFIGPYLTGLIRDTTGSYQYSYWFLALFFLLATLLVIVIMVMRMRGQKQSPG